MANIRGSENDILKAIFNSNVWFQNTPYFTAMPSVQNAGFQHLVNNLAGYDHNGYSFQTNWGTWRLAPYGATESGIFRFLGTPSGGTESNMFQIMEQGYAQFPKAGTGLILKTPDATQSLQVIVTVDNNKALQATDAAAGTTDYYLPTSTSAGSPGNNANINTQGISMYRANPGATVTGLVLQPGVYDGQKFTLINVATNSAFSLTFAGSGSNVEDGSNDVINAGTALEFIWDKTGNLWYRMQ